MLGNAVSVDVSTWLGQQFAALYRYKYLPSHEGDQVEVEVEGAPVLEGQDEGSEENLWSWPAAGWRLKGAFGGRLFSVSCSQLADFALSADLCGVFLSL